MIPGQTLLYIKHEWKPENVTDCMAISYFIASSVSKCCCLTIVKRLLLLRDELLQNQSKIWHPFIFVCLGCSSFWIIWKLNTSKAWGLEFHQVTGLLRSFSSVECGTLCRSVLLNSTSLELITVVYSAKSRLEIVQSTNRPSSDYTRLTCSV